jgi:hypothetical protein
LVKVHRVSGEVKEARVVTVVMVVTAILVLMVVLGALAQLAVTDLPVLQATMAIRDRMVIQVQMVP